MNNVERIEEEPNHFNNEQHQGGNNDVVTTTSEAVIAKAHEYILRKTKKAFYCEENENEINEDFSPDASEYLPSPERMKILQKSGSSSSIGGNSDYIETASQKIIKTPSTISNVSLVLNTIDFIASPSVIFEANKLQDNPKADTNCILDLTPTSTHENNGPSRYKAKLSSKRCLNKLFLNDNQPSTSYTSTIIDNHGGEKEGESSVPSLFDLDETLQPANISDCTLLDKTIINNENIIPSPQNLTQTEQNSNVVDHQSLDHNGDYDGEDQAIMHSFSTVQESTPQKKNTRKRKRNLNEHQDVKNKKLKNSGEAYKGCRSKKMYDKKVLKASCKCTKKCGEKVTHEQREYIMQQYYKIGDHERQWQYIVNHTLVEDVKRITVERKRTRTHSIKYFFTIDSNKIQVCKTFFINTLSISHQTVYTALEKSKPEENFMDKRGRHENRPRKMPILTEESIIKHIELFPTVESHYVRKDSSRKYLSELLNIAKMYRLYTAWFGQQRFDCPLATKRQYEIIFNTKFNFSFFKPKKDQCSQCTRYRQADSKTQETLQEKYDTHTKNKERVRQIKKDEKESVDPSETTVAIFDLEKVLSIPQSEVGSFHYKRKYPIYNFTVYDATQSQGYCYVWHGQIAKRGANEIGSCLWQFLLNEKQRGIQNISFYSDGCCGQNKNRFIFALYIFAAQKLQLNITHRFFETGHGQSEGDSMHSNIERELKHRVVYTPDQMYTIIMNAKVHGKKYQVKEMTQIEFYNIKELIENKNWLKNEEGQKISWTQIMEVNASHSNPSILKYKYNFDSDYSQLNTEPVRRIRSKRGTRQIPGPSPSCVPELQTLYTEPVPISKALYDDLISLCKAGDIPSYYCGFYESLTYGSTWSGDNDGNEEDNDD
ncbi:unnamed protein product [Colias eurytheme]|nr:unnamed protein product [Colias eurytheme]